MKTVTLKIAEVNCCGSEKLMKKQFSMIYGVNEVLFNLNENEVSILCDDDMQEDTLKEIVQVVGYHLI